MSTDQPRAEPTSGKRWVFVAGCAFILAAYTYLSLFLQNDALDDQWITFHYARNLARGFGFRWNPGEHPVEGFTCFLWVLVNAIGFRVHVQPLLWSQCWSFTAGIAAIAAVLSPWNILVRSRTWRLFLGLALAFCPVAVFMAQSGMETQLSVTLVLISCLAWAYAEIRGSRTAYLATSIMLVLACMTRPENGVFLVLIPVFTWWNSRHGTDDPLAPRHCTSPVLCLLLPALTIGTPYMIWRIWYFGYLLPNTYYAKYSGHGLNNLVLGFIYTGTVLEYYLAVPLLIAGLGLLLSRNGRKRVNAQLFCICLVFTGYITLAGGDDVAAFPMGRLLIPVIFVTVVLAASCLEELFSEQHRKIGASRVAALLMLLILFQELPLFESLGKEANPGVDHTYSVRRAVFSVVGEKAHHLGAVTSSPITGWVLQHTGPHDLIAFGGAGRIPYATDRPTIDLWGLNDTHIAHMKVSGRGLDTKTDPAYVVGRDPKLIMLGVTGSGCDSASLKEPFCHLLGRTKALVDAIYESGKYQLAPVVLPWGNDFDGVGGIRVFVRKD